MSGLHRTDMAGGSVQFVLIKVSNDTSRTESLLRTINPATSISGTARFSESSLGASEGTTSSGFGVATNVTVVLDATGIEWNDGVIFTGDGSIEITDERFKTFNSFVRTLALTHCLFEEDVTVNANLLWVEDCLFNGRNDVPVENRFWIQEQFEMRNSELVDNIQVTAAPLATISLADNTFYGEVYVPDAPEDANIAIRNNTLIGGRIHSFPHIDQDYNYYGAYWSELLNGYGGWLNPYHIEQDFPCASQGDIERCSLTEPRNLAPLRGTTCVFGQEVMKSDQAHLRAGQDIAFSFRPRSYVEELAGASYELIYDGKTYTPNNSFTARATTDDISIGYHNANNTLNFIVPAGSAGTNQWVLRADFSGISANIVTPATAVQEISSGSAVIQPDFARPLRIGVLELQLEVGYTLSNCMPTARSDAMQSIRNALVSLLPLRDEDVDIVDMGIYPFSGGWFSSWFSGTDIGRANQITSELEWFVGHYNSTAQEPLDFLVGVAPVGSLGGSDGLSMALRRRAVLVDEMSPDAVLHEMGHSMGLYLSKEQYDLPFAYSEYGIMYPPRGLQIGGITAFNASGRPSSVVPNGEIQHFPAYMLSMVYDVMGAANPQWISAGTHEDMSRWLVEKLGLAESGSKSSRLPDPQKKASSSNRVVHVAALIARGSDKDEMVGSSIRIEEVANTVSDSSAIYSLNFRFESYDAEGALLSCEQCKTHISTIVSNRFWQQTFAVPTNAARYRMMRTPSLGQSGYSEIWTYQVSSSLSNSLQLTYNAPLESYLLTFTNSGSRRTVENRLLLSRDGGTNWIPLPLPTYTNEVWMPLTALPAGTPNFKLYSSDGIQTVISDAVEAGATPSLPPSVRILSPQNGMQGLTGMIWSLEANIYDPNGDIPTIQWASNLDGVLGTNAVLSSIVLSEGTHHLSVVATDSGGLAATGTVTVTAGDLSTVDLSLSASDILMSPADNGLYNAIGYGTSNILNVAVRNQGVSNLVDIQVFLTRPGVGESEVYSNTWSMSAFETQSAEIGLDAQVRGDYQVRAVCTSAAIPDINADNNEIIVLYTNQPPAVSGKRFSVMVEDLPLVIPLSATDPNLDSATFHLTPAAGASLSGGNMLTFDNGGTTGTFTVQFTASDVSLTSTPAAIVIDVYGVDPATLPPVIISPTNHYATSGVPVQISILVDNGPCTFSAINLPVSLTLDEDTGDINGTITFANTYEFSVTAQNAIGSNTVFMNLFVAEAPPPANDNFADAELLVGVPVMAIGTTAGGSREPGEPQHAGMSSFKSVWYRWTAPTGGVVAVRGAGYTAGIAVYTGSTLNALSEQSSFYGYNPLTCFQIEAGQEYFIAVETFTDTPFIFVLDYEFTPALKAPRQISAVQSNPVDVTFTTWNPADNFSATGLPGGLTLDPVSGHLTGSPTGYSIMPITANIITTNSFGSSTSSVSFSIQSANSPRFTSPLYASGSVGDSFTYNVLAENVTEGWLFVMSLPSGLLFDDVGRIISGTPEEHGFFTVYLSGSNMDTMEFADEELSLLIRPAYTNWSSDHELTGGADDDDDSDGASNFEEFIAGTDPNDPDDVLQARLVRQGSGFVLDWPSRTGHCYNVQNSFSLSGGFSTVSNYVSSTPPTNILNLSTGSTSQFFRISVQE
ncbi:MAG: Ig domain-containing protein [Kiritimatiellae bacterium]|nr:Ig domain-containing protein [Kiritimatiellia bacterium]